jgi:hypothetical protein
MTFDVAAAVDQFRALEEDGLTDQCVIREPSTRQFDTAVGEYATVPGTVVYDGPCRYIDDDRADPTPQAGETEVTMRRGVLVVPWTVEAAKDQTVTVASSADPQLDGAEFRITEVETDSWLITRHLAVEAPLERSATEVTDV